MSFIAGVNCPVSKVAEPSFLYFPLPKIDIDALSVMSVLKVRIVLTEFLAKTRNL